MNNDQSKSSLYIKIAGILIILLLIVFGIKLYESSLFKVTAVDPELNQVDTWTPEFVITFSKPVVSKGLSISTSPGLIYNKEVFAADHTLNISLNVPLSSKHSYYVTINNIMDTKGQTIKNKQFVFTPTAVSIKNLDHLDDDEAEALHAREKPLSDPILAHLPYDNLYFNLTDTINSTATGSSTLTLNAQIFINQSEMNNQASAVAQGKQMVASYISSLGLDPSKYNIQYTIITP